MELATVMKEILRVFKKRISQMENEEYRITHEQLGLLHAIGMKEDDVIQKDMAEFMGKDKSTILRLIDSLEDKDFVRRVTDKNDRRKNYIMVTKAGEKAIAEFKSMGKSIMEDLKVGINENDILIFQKVLNQIRNNAENL